MTGVDAPHSTRSIGTSTVSPEKLRPGTDPVDLLGADVTTVYVTRGPAQLALSDLHFAAMAVEALHGPLFAHDRERRLTREP